MASLAERHIVVYGERQRLHESGFKPKDAVIRRTLDNDFKKLRDSVMSLDKTENSTLNTEFLEVGRRMYMERLGVVHSPLRVSTDYIEYLLLNGLIESAEDSLATRNPLSLIYYTDLYHGVLSTQEALINAEEAVSKGADLRSREMLGITEEQLNQDIPLPMASDYYLVIKEQLEEYRNLLLEDSTGFKVVDVHVENIKSMARWLKEGEVISRPSVLLQPFEVPEFVIAGAELTRDLYKKVYPEAFRLPPMEPS